MPSDAFATIAEANPVRAQTSLPVDSAALLRATRERMRDQSIEGGPPRSGESVWRRHRIVIGALAAITALGLALPALAISGVLGDLFGFSTQGAAVTSIPESSLSTITRVGATPESIQLIATRGGKSFYAARSTEGHVCIGVADATASALTFTRLQCGGSQDNSFPSPAIPVVVASPVFGGPDSADAFLKELAGFAADGVARVEAIGPSGVVATAEASGNVFYAAVPHGPVTSIAAYDDAGNKVWSEPLTHP